ncbi:MAG: PAS domain S-box protein [Deltaproteobacteria bacterium]|nr:PAS domain S-box protein [Deltaproteobacteria bacterium]
MFGRFALTGTKTYLSPVRVLAVMALAIFTAEALVIVVLFFIPGVSGLALTLIDASLLVLLLSPALYFHLFRPLVLLVDERRRVEEELKTERDRAQGYLDVAGVILVALDRDGHVKLINRKSAELLGYEEKDIAGKGWFDEFTPPGSRAEARAWFLRLMMAGEGGSEGSYESPLVTRSGEERVILWSYTVLRDNGHITGALGSGEDITERKRTEMALVESETRYRLIHNTAFDAIIVSDDGDRVTDCNPSAEKIFGYTRDELIGLNLTLLMPDKYRERHREGLKRFLAAGTSRVQGRIQEFECLRKDGTLLPIEIILNHFTLGGRTSFTGTIRDITERKRAEREREFIQSSLSQSRKMEAIGRLAGGIAHDFNNVLTAIRGNAEFAMEDIDKEDPAYPRLNEIMRSVEHASRLTRQLLLFSRGQPVERAPLNINTVIENLLVMVTRLLGADITVAADLAPDLWTVLADEGNIEQVVMNLAVNARDAMPNGGHIVIKTENVVLDERSRPPAPEARPGRFIRLTVSDTGVGMEQEIIQRIFEPFFTTKGAGKGTGLGLSVIYGVVKQLGGWIAVESEPNKGSAFRIYLPAIEETPPVSG